MPDNKRDYKGSCGECQVAHWQGAKRGAGKPKRLFRVWARNADKDGPKNNFRICKLPSRSDDTKVACAFLLGITKEGETAGRSNGHRGISLRFRVLNAYRQPTTRQGNGDGQQQERPNRELEPPTEDQAGDKPENQEHQCHSDVCDGNQHGPALVVNKGHPRDRLRQPQKHLDGQQPDHEVTGREVEEADSCLWRVVHGGVIADSKGLIPAVAVSTPGAQHRKRPV